MLFLAFGFKVLETFLVIKCKSTELVEIESKASRKFLAESAFVANCCIRDKLWKFTLVSTANVIKSQQRLRYPNQIA